MKFVDIKPNEILLHAKQVSTMLHLRECTVYEMARKGTLPSIRIGNRIVRFRRSSIEQWLAERESGGHDVA